MVLDGLAADEQPVADLRIRQTAAEQPENLRLTLRQHTADRLAGCRSDAEQPQHGGRLVGRPRRLQPFEGVEGGARFDHRHFGTLGQKGVGQRETRMRKLHGHLCARETGEGLA